MIHETAGISPCFTSLTKFAGSWTLSHIGPYRTCLIICMTFIHAFSLA